LRKESASAFGRAQAALIKQRWIARITVTTICMILISVFFYSLLQNRLIAQLKVSGIATTARVIKKARLFGQWWNGRPIDSAIITFKYKDAGGDSHEAWQTISEFLAPNVSPGDQFPVWYDRAHPDRVLTPWTDSQGPAEVRLVSIILLLLVAIVAVFVITKPQINRSRQC
jgi:Protein of unknown function (DUF3592)